MQISNLLRIMRQLIDLQEKKKGKRKDNLWYRLENPTGTLGSYLGKKKSGASRGSRTVAAEPKLPSVIIEILKNSVPSGSKKTEK